MLSQNDAANIRSGNSVLLLGAGATAGSSRFNNDRRPILGAAALAEKIANELSLPYANEHLREVYDAATQIKTGKQWIHSVLLSEYTAIRPSSSISSIFNYPWYRVYTLNIDDSLSNTPKAQRVQQVRFINGVNTDRSEWAGRMTCQVVHLHGMAQQIESGVVFSDEEYGVVYDRRLGWYQQLREDFRTRNVYIIGSQLDEPFILSLIKREASALKDAKSASLVVPIALTPVRTASLALANIQHVKGTLEDFVNGIRNLIGDSYSPANIVAEETNIPELLSQQFSQDDIPALQSLIMITAEHLDRTSRRLLSLIRKDRARFLNGFGPNWGIISDPAFAELRQYEKLDSKILRATSDHRLIIIKGEAGSGKSTYIYRLAGQLARQGRSLVFEYRETSASFFQVMSALKRFAGGKPAVIIIDDFRVFAEDLADYFSDNNDQTLTFVVDARSSEWAGILRRLFSDEALVLDLNRFDDIDAESIVELIENKHIAPAFNALSRSDRINALKSSKRQLLFAIREASQSKEFDQTVVDEVKTVTEPYARALLNLASFCTLARTGLKPDVAASIVDGMLKEAGDPYKVISFEEGLRLLPGMVDETSSGTLRVRHDIYANIVLSTIASAKDVRSVIDAILQHFSQFATPIISHISKLEGQLFKYALNNRNVYRLFEHRQSPGRTIGIYTDMEQRLQLDGHFWLQYGLLLRRFGKQDEALEKFERSIEAYDNDFARHARSQQQLIVAALADASSPKKVARAKMLVKEAEAQLVERHHNPASARRRLDDSDYPISVLGHYHIDALMNLGSIEEARAMARKYFNWINDLEKRNSNVSLPDLKERLMRMGVNGQWERNSYKIGDTEYHR